MTVDEVKQGDKVVVPKGTVIRTMHPSRGPRYEAKRDTTVKVSTVYDWKPEYSGREPQISWAGSGGYWCEAPISACRPISN